MTTAFISFPPGSGGNHLRNVIANGSDFLPDLCYQESIDAQYNSGSNAINAHGDDLGSTSIDGNMNSFKLHRALMNPTEHVLLYGHFAEMMSFSNEIKQIRDKKFILLSFDTDLCKKIWINRSKELRTLIGLDPNTQSTEDPYFIGEQVFLYEPFIYYDFFKTKQSNVMNIGIHEWFNADITDILNRLSFFLESKFDHAKCQQMHSTWFSKNSKFVEIS